MLTSDLLQVKVSKKGITPKYIEPDNAETLALAATLIGIFESSLGRPRRELHQGLEAYLGTGTAFLLHRGLSKLLEDRCEFETQAELEPAILRRHVFEAAAEAYREESAGRLDRLAVLERVAASLEGQLSTVENIERSLWADLKEEQILAQFKRCSPEWLVDRYNVALAQAVLLRAVRLKIHIAGETPQRYREIFRSLKFHRLLYRVEERSAEGCRLVLDGPLSLFKSSNRYGLQMASFLPALLHASGWELEAEVLWGKKRVSKRFQLSSQDGLRSHTVSKGQWRPDEIEWFEGQFAKLGSEWRLSTEAEVVDLGKQGVLIPDYSFRWGDTDLVAHLEILGFWRRGAVQSRLKVLRELGPAHLILAISKELRVDDEDIEGLASEVYVFRTTPIAREVLERLEAIRESAGTE